MSQQCLCVFVIHAVATSDTAIETVVVLSEPLTRVFIAESRKKTSLTKEYRDNNQTVDFFCQ